MKNFFKKLSFVLAIAMVLTSLTPAVASAASKNFVTLKGNSSKPVTSVYAWIGGVTRNLDYNIGGKTSGVKGTWKSNNTKVVKVNASTGVLTPVANGTTTVTFTPSNGKNAVKTTVKVRTRAAALHIYDKAEYAAGNKVQLEEKEGVTPSAIELKVGETKELKVTMPLSKKQQNAGAKKASYFTYAEVGDNAIVEAVKDEANGDERAYTLNAKAVGETTVTIVANQSTLANVRKNKYFREGTITVKVSEAEPDVAVKQTGAKKITMTGKDLTDVATDYVLKRGTVTVELEKVAFTTAEDKTSVDLFSKSSRLTAGEYTLQFKDNTPLAFTVETSKLDHFDIPSDTLPLDDEYNKASSATVAYFAYNQFGEDITKSVSTVNANSTFGSASASSSKKEVSVKFIENATKPLIGATGTIVLVDTSTGVSYSKNLTLGMQAKADTIEVLGVYNAKTSEKMEIKENSKNTDAVLLVKVSDQYGVEMNHLNCAANGDVAFTFTAGLTNIKVEASKDFTDTVDVDGVTYVAIPLSAGSAKAGTAQVFFVSTSTGKNTSASITVGANATVTSIDVYPINDVYAGTTVEFGYTALTEDGSEVREYSVLSNKDYGVGPHIANGNITCNFGTFRWRKNSDDTASLFLDVNADATAGYKSTLGNATFITAGHGVKTITFTIMAKQVPTTIKEVKAGTILTAITGGSIELGVGDFNILDQYGDPMSVTAVNEAFGSGYKIVVSGAAASVLSGFSGAEITTSAKATLTMANTEPSEEAARSTKLTFTIANASGTVNAGEQVPAEATVSVVGLDKLVRFEIDTEDKIYAPASQSAVHEKAFTVYGYTAKNAKAIVPAKNYESVSYSIENVLEVTSAGAVAATIGGIEGVAWSNVANPSETKSITVNVTVNSKVASKVITACEEAPVLTTFGANPYNPAVVSTGTNSIQIYDTNTNLSNKSVMTYIAALDQYGVNYKDAQSSEHEIIVITLPTGSNLTVTGNGTKDAKVGTMNAGDSYTATVTYNGKTLNVEVIAK